MDRRTDGQTDGWTNGQSETNIPPNNFVVKGQRIYGKTAVAKLTDKGGDVQQQYYCQELQDGIIL